MSRRKERGTHVSASQISLFRECPRRWGYKYVEGLPEPANEYEQAGLDVHEAYEFWFRDGKPFDLNTRAGEIAYAGRNHYPAPSPELRVEQEARFEFDGIEYLGYVDLHYLRQPEDAAGRLVDALASGSVAAATEAAAAELVIDDHKTTSDLKWVKTEEQLLEDPQRTLYAAWGTVKYGVDHVRTRWVYHQRKPPWTSRVVEFSQAREEIWNVSMPPVHATAKEVVRSRNLKVLDLQQNLNACRSYNKDCPFMDRCKPSRSVFDRMSSILAQAERADRAGQQRSAPPMLSLGGAQGSARALQEKEGGTMSLLEKLRSGGASVAEPARPEAARPGMDPARVRAAYEKKEGEAFAEDASAAESAALTARIRETTHGDTPEEAAAAVVAPGGLLAKLRAGEKPKPTEAEPEAPVDLPSPSGLLAELKGQAVEPQPETEKTTKRGKKNGATEGEGGIVKLAIADAGTGKLVLHAIGLLAGRSVEEVQAHTKALYGGG